MFFYRESVDVDYSMEIQQKSGVTLCVNSYGGEVETCAQHIIKANTIDTLKFLHDECFELQDRFPKDVVFMVNAHALEENTRAVIDPLLSNKQACGISICSSYGAGADQIFLCGYHGSKRDRTQGHGRDVRRRPHTVRNRFRASSNEPQGTY
jgi:hypothetical protein